MDYSLLLERSPLRSARPPPSALLSAAKAGVHMVAVCGDGAALVAAGSGVVEALAESESGQPPHWLGVNLVLQQSAQYLAIRRDIERSSSSPFVAGSLSHDTIIMTLKRRAPGLDHSLPLPLPLTLDSVLALGSDSLGGSSSRSVSSTNSSDVQKAIDCGALVDAEGPIHHWSPMFSIAQTKKSRLIFDLRGLNECLLRFPFRLETLVDLPALAKGCRFASKLDLQSAYWQYPVDESLSRALGTSCSEMPGRLLRWTCLPFGLSAAPYAFASLTHAFVRAWRECGLIVTAYLDDILVLSPSLDEHLRAVSIVVGDLLAAGMRISPSKAFILPYTRLDYLGLTIDLQAEAFAIPADYASKVKDEVRAILDASGARGAVSDIGKRTIGTLRIQRLLGRIAFLGLAVPWISCFRAHLTRLIAGSPPPLHVSLDDGSIEELHWWLGDQAATILARHWPWYAIAHTKLYSNGTKTPLPQFIVHGDASDTGIGMRLADGELVSEPLPPELPASSPSVSRELYAMCRLVERGLFPRGSVVRLMSDATGAVRTALGATVTPATAPWARRLFLSALERDVVVQVEWVPRALLADVDEASRWDASDASHGRLPIGIVRQLVSRAFGPGEIDVEFFTAVHNRVAPRTATFLTRDPQPFSSGDGLCPSFWSSAKRGWAFPPFSLVRPVLRLAVTRRPAVIIVLPNTSLIRSTLRQWTCVPVPPPLAPPNFIRPMSTCQPLAAFLPPVPLQATSTASRSSPAEL